MISQPLAMSTPQEVQDEVCTIFEMMEFSAMQGELRDTFSAVTSLYDGRWPGYHACDTPYHNIEHVMLVTLAMSRLLHGAFLDGHPMDDRAVLLSLVAALFHDTGLIRHHDDSEALGAELTSVHVNRSAALTDAWIKERGATAKERDFVASLLFCTELEASAEGVSFVSESQRYLGSLLKAADLAGQVADLSYAAKLPLLAEELAVAEPESFGGTEVLIQGTPRFCRMVLEKLVVVSGRNLLSHSRSHFFHRFGIDADLYTEQIKRQIALLEELMENGIKGYWDYLETGGENGLSAL
ncbi:MAG: hypothetical protein MI742_05470 [Desulfobacterales bacterium]|nr:hypothetical protein [Desulfobacterales bacterium]